MLSLDIVSLGAGWRQKMRAIAPLLAGFLALAVVSTHGRSDGNNENWRPLDRALSFSLGGQVCGDGWHQALWRDWHGDWWWGPCVPNR